MNPNAKAFVDSITPEALEGMREAHIMKSPSDLDLFSPIQVEITKEIDGLQGGINQMAGPAAMFVNSVMRAAKTEIMEPHAWQRTSFELDAIAKEPGASSDIKTMARAVWAFTKFLQECHEISLDSIQMLLDEKEGQGINFDHLK